MLQQGCAATAAVFRCSEGGVMVTTVFFLLHHLHRTEITVKFWQFGFGLT